MNHILGISGSLRKGSYNSALLRAAAGMDGVDLEIADISGIPLYNADVEKKGMPEPVVALHERLAEADGLLLATPEYNSGIPGVLKNTLDWLSRPTPNALREKPVAILGASPGGFGTIMAQAAWLPVLKSIGACHWSRERLLISGANRVFDANGELIDREIAEKLHSFLRGFSSFIDS
jgi:NAD(P)H-dependent FMN reductase